MYSKDFEWNRHRKGIHWGRATPGHGSPAQVVLLGSEGLPEGAVLSLKSGLAAFKCFQAADSQIHSVLSVKNCRWGDMKRQAPVAILWFQIFVEWLEKESGHLQDLEAAIGFFSLIEIAFSTWWFHQKLSRCFQMCKKIPSLRLNIKSLRGERWNHRPLRSPKQGNTFASTTLPRIQCRWRQLGTIVYIVLADDV